MKNLRSKKGRDLPEIRVLGLPELFFSFSFKRIFKGELPKLRGMTSWMVKVVDACESSDKSTCTPHVCTTMSNSHQLIWTASQRSVREIQAGVSTSCWNLAEIPIADSDLAKPPSECSREWKSSSKTLPPRANPGQRQTPLCHPEPGSLQLCWDSGRMECWGASWLSLSRAQMPGYHLLIRAPRGPGGEEGGMPCPWPLGAEGRLAQKQWAFFLIGRVWAQTPIEHIQ